MRILGKSSLLVVAASIAGIASLRADDPYWWTSGSDPVITGSPEANRAVANIGQAKWMAKSALEALAKVVPDLADDIEADLVGAGKLIVSWGAPSNPEAAAAQFSPLSVGQLKAISAPFYDRLHTYAPGWVQSELARNGTLQSGSHYPWTTSTVDDDNKAMANIGQMKAVFGLDFSGDREAGPDIDMIPDLWEYAVIHEDGGVQWSDIDEINNLNAIEAGISSGVAMPFVTVGMHAGPQLGGLIEGKNAAATMPLYTKQVHIPNPPTFPDGEYVRNPAFWGADLGIELTCISPANTTGSASNTWHQIGVTAITKRLVVMVHHNNFYVPNTQKARFVTVANDVIAREVIASIRVAETDLRIGLLASDLPSTIKPCLIPPENFRDYFPKKVSGGAGSGVLGLLLDQEEKGIVGNLSAVTLAGCSFGVPRDSHAASFNEPLVEGDSGNPGFLIINGRLMLMTAWTFGGGGSGSSPWGNNWEDFNDVVDQLNAIAGVSGAGYELEIADLSAFSKLEPGGL